MPLWKSAVYDRPQRPGRERHTGFVKRAFSSSGIGCERIYQAEIRDLADAGAAYIQLDEVALAMLCDPRMREQVGRNGGSAERLADLYVAAFNSAVAGRPPGVVIGEHMCPGNYKGRHLA